jgi:zinc protease
MNFPRSTATQTTLPNGLTLILDPHHDHPVVSAKLLVETGSIHEDQWLGSGLSHFLEHMVFKGTANFSGDRLAAIVQAAGGHWNAYTSFDRTVYYIDGPAEGLPTFLHVLTDMVFRPTLPESEFEREKDVIRREIDMGLDDPQNATMRLLLETAFRDDPRRLPVIGHRSAFDAIQHHDLCQYHRQRYTTNRAYLVISGDFSVDAAMEQIKALTADLVPGMATEPFIPTESPQCSRREAEATFTVPQSKVMLAWKIPAMGHPDMPAYELLSMMLGSGQSSHLYRELRENRELVHEIGAFTWSNHVREGLLGIVAECDPSKRQEFIEAALAEMANFAEADMEVALARSKRQLLVSQFRSLTSASGRAADLMSNWHEARDLSFTARFLEAVDRVTPADIRRCLATLADRNLTITQLNPLGTDASIASDRQQRSSLEPIVKTLSCGLEVALFPDPRLPLLSMQLAFRGGLSSESSTDSGITSLLASTLNEGTRQRTSLEIANTLEGLGASLHASAGNNTLTISANGLAEDRAVLVDILADVALHPAFPDAEMNRNRTSQLHAIEEMAQDPFGVCMLQLRRLLFSSSTYGLPNHGSSVTVAALTRDDLLAYHREMFCAENGKLAIAGDFDAAEMLDLLEKHFRAMPSGQAFVAPASKLQHDQSVTAKLPKKQAVLAIAYPGISATDPRRFAAMMLQEYCSDMAGPLFTRIREELGLAYQVGAFAMHGHDTGMVAFYLSTSPEQRELAHRELQQQIEIIAEQGIPDESFEQVRATVLSGLVMQQQSPSATAQRAAVNLLFGLPATHQREVHQFIRAVTPAEVRELSQHLLQANRSVTSLVLPGSDEG